MGNAVEKMIPEQEVERFTGTAITPADMLNTALTNNTGPEVMERLMALHERWEANQARKAFDMAIAQAKADIPPIIKNAEVDFTSSKGRTNYRHETLDGIARVVDPILSQYGLSYRFRSKQEGSILSVTCIVAHRDGYSEETTLSGPPDQSGNKNAYQAVGSAATYLQRYTLKLALGLSAAHDDDAQSVPRQDEGKPEASASKNEQARAIYTAAEHDIRNASSMDELRRIWGLIDWDAIPADWKRDLVKEKNHRVDALKKPQAQSDDFPGDLGSHLDRTYAEHLKNHPEDAELAN